MAAKTPRNASAVMAMLMQPIADAELADPELERLEKKALKERIKQLDGIWHIGTLHVSAAKYELGAAQLNRLVKYLTKHPDEAAASKVQDEAARKWRTALVRQIEMPASLPKHVTWKRDHLKYLRGGYLSEEIPRLEALIESETAQFKKKPA